MKVLKRLLLSLAGLIIYSCGSQHQLENTIERCDDCIYFEDYRNYELAKGSTELISNKRMLFENVFQWKSPEGYVSPTSNPLKCFMRKETIKDELNLIVCYQVQKVKGTYTSYNDTLVEAELYKVFLKEGHLDEEGINYPIQDGNYTTLKNYFENLTDYLPNSSKSTPQNINDVTDSKIRNDIKTYVDIENQIMYTMTVNSSQFVDYMNTPESHTLDDMGIYITYLTKTPTIAFSNIYESVKEAKDFIENDIYAKGKLEEVYNSLSSIAKKRLEIIRQKRGLIPFTDLIDSVNLYRDTWIKEKQEQ